MASGFGYSMNPQQVAPPAQSVGQALLQRRVATNPASAQPGMPNLVGNTARGVLPQIGRRLLQANPSQLGQSIPTPAGQSFGGWT
jgi:hypothetical protein